jgi:hypothetical protein
MLAELLRTLHLINMEADTIDFKKGVATASSCGVKVLLRWDKKQQWWDVVPVLF